MSWVCRLVDVTGFEGTDFARLAPGSLYFAPWLLERSSLSNQYRRDWAGKRPPLVLVVPGYGGHCLDQEWWPYMPGRDHDGWEITGDPPQITASPSLGIGKDVNGRWAYHGWLRDGFLSDDIEGRTY